VGGGQKLTLRVKVWLALSTPTPDIEHMTLSSDSKYEKV
jgi:hypothetical protein